MERQKNWMTSGTFAKLCGTTKETLRHYKDINLLVPAYQGENGYFYYDAEQFYDFYAISIFRQTGTPLEEIRCCLQGKNIEGTMELLKEQKIQLERERNRLDQMDFVLSSAIRSLELGSVQDMLPRTARFEREHLLVLPAQELEELMNPTDGKKEMLITVLDRCQQLCRKYKMQTDYQLGAIHLPGSGAEQTAISHLYTRIKEYVDCPYYMEKSAGDYLFLCCRGSWDISEGYTALAQYAEENKLQTSGGIYACDLAGFILNGTEKNAISMISVRLAEK